MGGFFKPPETFGFWYPVCVTVQVPQLRNSSGSVTLVRKPVRMDGSGTLRSTLDDFFRFARMLANKGELDGTRVLKAETIELICQNQFKHLGVKLEPEDMRGTRAFGFSEFGWGLGGAVNGEGYYGWGGASGVTFWANTADKTCGVLMRQGFSRPSFEKIGNRATLPE